MISIPKLRKRLSHVSKEKAPVQTPFPDKRAIFQTNKSDKYWQLQELEDQNAVNHETSELSHFDCYMDVQLRVRVESFIDILSTSFIIYSVDLW